MLKREGREKEKKWSSEKKAAAGEAAATATVSCDDDYATLVVHPFIVPSSDSEKYCK